MAFADKMRRGFPVAIVIVALFCHVQAEKTTREKFREALSQKVFGGADFEQAINTRSAADKSRQSTITFDHKRGIAMVRSHSSKNCYLFDSVDVKSLDLDNPGLKWKNFEIIFSDETKEINKRYMIEVQDPVTGRMCAEGKSYWVPSESFKSVNDVEKREVSVSVCLGAGVFAICSSSPSSDVQAAYDEIEDAINKMGGLDKVIREATKLFGVDVSSDVEGVLDDIFSVIESIAGGFIDALEVIGL